MQQINELFQREGIVIIKQISNVFEARKLDKESNVQISYIPNSNRPFTLYNLYEIISVEYRGESFLGTHFCRWMTAH